MLSQHVDMSEQCLSTHMSDRAVIQLHFVRAHGTASSFMLTRSPYAAQASLRDRITAAPLGTPPPSPARQGAFLHQSASSPAAIPSQVPRLAIRPV
jgi:hypothetical protein